jgi:hypothetical protein
MISCIVPASSGTGELPMPRFKHTDTTQTLMVPVRLSDQLVPGTFEHALQHIVDHHIDLKPLAQRWFHNDRCGSSAYHPACLLKIVLLGYSRGLFSSRRIARACQSNILFIAMSGGLHPHFTTVACFVRNLQEEVLSIFTKVLLICSQMGLVGGELFAVDGCKIPSNASKEWSGTFEELEAKKQKIRTRIQQMMSTHAREDRRESRSKASRFAARVRRQRQAIQRIADFLASHQPKPGKDQKEIQSNVTDNESAKLKGSHGTIQGYNALALVDAKQQVIVAAEPVASVHEGEHLEDILDQAQSNAKAAGMGDKALEGTTVVADASYYSEDNLKLCDQRRIHAYIPDPYFRSRDPRFPRTNRRRQHQDLFGQGQFRFDRSQNGYLCPQGKLLRFNTRAAHVGRFVGRRYEARKIDCQACPLKDRCLKKGASRRKLFFVDRTLGPDLLDQMRKRIDSARGRSVYARRMAIVEPVFANITVAKRLDTFTLRGKAKVRVQWLMYAMVHNIEKIAHYGSRDGPPRRRPGGRRARTMR